MIRPVYNLNEMAHDATIKLIRQVLDKNVNVEEVKYRLCSNQFVLNKMKKDVCRSSWNVTNL